MNKSVVVQAYREPKTKKQAEGVPRKLGLSSTEEIQLFYRQSCLHGVLPFPVLAPNELKDKKALEKSQKGADVVTLVCRKVPYRGIRSPTQAEKVTGFLLTRFVDLKEDGSKRNSHLIRKIYL